MELTLKMIAVLRLMMPEINMVAATANQTVDPQGREKAILAGANVIMPNLTPNEFRENYLIYPDKACVKDGATRWRLPKGKRNHKTMTTDHDHDHFVHGRWHGHRQRS